MVSLRVPIHDLAEFRRVKAWRETGVTAQDVLCSQQCGIDAHDVSTLREFASRRFILVVRCPRPTRRARRGGVARCVPAGDLVAPFASRAADWRLMSVWKTAGGRPSKVVVASADGVPYGRGGFEGRVVVLELNSRLRTRIRLGCQDDDCLGENRGVDPRDRFVVFGDGGVTVLPSAAACAEFYRQRGLVWPYDRAGKHVGPG